MTPLFKDIRLTQDTDRGIITGGNAEHWSCIGAMVISANRDGVGLAVANHGLTRRQVKQLDRAGVRWIEHEHPSIDHVPQFWRTSNHPRAWYKPLICQQSPFDRTIWLDADACAVGELTPLFEMCESGPCVGTQRLWVKDSIKLYRRAVYSLFKAKGLHALTLVSEINNGVIAWKKGTELIDEWWYWCQRVMNTTIPSYCQVRDQCGMCMALVARVINQHKEHVTLLGDEWDVPADFLAARQSKKRLPIDLTPDGFYREAKERHYGVKVVHWLGCVKPWNITKDEV